MVATAPRRVVCDQGFAMVSACATSTGRMFQVSMACWRDVGRTKADPTGAFASGKSSHEDTSDDQPRTRRSASARWVANVSAFLATRTTCLNTSKSPDGNRKHETLSNSRARYSAEAASA